jgi:hypothetical protein
MNWGRKYFWNVVITEEPGALPLPNWKTEMMG